MHEPKTIDRVLITGGAGFLGSHLCDHFLGLGAEVVCVDNLVTGSEANIAHLAGDPAFRFVEADVTEPFSLEGDLDAVLHFASPASPVAYLRLPIETLRVNAVGAYNALDMARSKGCSFLLASTSEVYGDPEVHPQPEEYWGSVNPIGPRGVYDEAKRYAEALTMSFHQIHGVDTKIARIFNTYGSRMRPHDGRVVPTFICQALEGKPLTIYGDGSQTRSFCHVSDLVRGIDALLRSSFHLPVNLGNPEESTIAEFAATIQAHLEAPSSVVFEPLPVDDPKVRRPDITRAVEILGWRPEVPLSRGLEMTIPYYRRHL